MKTIVTPLLIIPKTNHPPRIDGLLDDEVWRSAAHVHALQCLSDGEPSEDPTELWLTYDDDNLYIAARCLCSNEPREGIVEDWRLHERFMLSWAARRRLYGFSLHTEDGPQVKAPQGPPKWWGQGCRLEVQFGDSSWQFEAAIPFARFGVKSPKPGSRWAFGIDRMQRKRREADSCWCQPYIDMDFVRERAGDIVFAGENPVTCSVVTMGERRIGSNALTLDLHNRRTEPVKLTASVSVRGARKTTLSLALAPNEQRQADVPYLVKDGDAEIALTVRDDSTGALLCRFGSPVGLAPNKARLKGLAAQLRELKKTGPGKGALKASRLAKRRKALWEAANAAAATRQDWTCLDEEIRALALAVSKAAVRRANDDPTLPYALTTYGPLITVFRDEPLPAGARQAIGLSACRNEREVAQLVILPCDLDLHKVRLEISDLAGNNSTISRENVELNLVDYVWVKPTRYRQERLGWYPDPLLPLEPFDVAADSLQPLWVAVYVPKDAAAGDYQGEIRVIPENAPPISVPLRLHVWDFELPLRPALRTSFALFESEINELYGWTGDLPQALRRQHYDLLLKRRINAGCCYSHVPMPRLEDLDYCMERGSNAITLGCIPDNLNPWRDEDLNPWLDMLEPYLNYLKQKGWYDLAWCYGYDEVVQPGYDAVRETYGRIARRYPGLKRAVTLGSVENPDLLSGAADIFIPETDRYRQEPLQRRQRAGDEAWTYTSMWPRHPFANAFTDYPRIDQRILFWQCWKYRVDGFMYYAINMWHTNSVAEPEDVEGDSRIHADPLLRQAIREGKRYPDVPWNTYAGDGAMAGDGQLVYPGHDGILLSSIRLESISQGIEDYDYLALLDGLTKQLRAADAEGKHQDLLARCDQLLAVRPEITSDFTHYTKDPELLEAERTAVANLILEVKSLLQGHA